MWRGNKVEVFKHRRVDGRKEGNRAGTRMVGVARGTAGQTQFMFYCKTSETTWKEF